MNKNFSPIETHIYQAWYLDGLYELGFGFSLLIFGGAHFSFSHIGTNLQKSVLLGVVFPLLVIGVVYGSRILIQQLKKKITYPRTGYIRFRKVPKEKRFSKIALRVSLMVGVITLVNGMIYFFSEALSPVVLSLLSWSFISLAFAAITLWQGIRFDLVRFKIIAAAEIGLGFVTGYFVPEAYQMLSFLCGSGIFWLVSGGMTLFDYLRHTAVVEEGGLDEE